MIIKRLFLLFVALATTLVAWADDLRISVEGLNFFEKSGRTIIDVNYSIKYKNLGFKFNEKNKIAVANLKVECAVYNKSGVLLREDFSDKIVVTNEKDIKSDSKVHNSRYSFDYEGGGNNILLRFTDLVSGDSYVYKEVLKSISQNKISSIELNNFVQDKKTNTSPQLYRGEILYNSNPERVFYKELSDSLYCYFQLNDLKKASRSEWSYNYTITVRDSNGEKLFTEDRLSESNSEIASIVHGIGIQNLDNGLYTITVENTEYAENNISRTDFSISDFAGEMISMLNDPEEEFFLIKYFGYDETSRRWENFPRSRKIKEINKFWNIYSTKMNMSVNSLDEILKERIEYANLKFSSKTPGWKSDRGKVYILYGAPDDIDKYLVGEMDATDQSDLDSQINRAAVFNDREYEIWRYTSSRIASYTFFDTRLDNSHKLIYIYNDPNMETSADYKFYLGQDFDEDVLK